VRPDRIVIVVGTGTDVGKTWVACALIGRLRSEGLSVLARKPAQSFDPVDAAAERTDAHLLGGASNEDPERVTPPHRWYPLPLAPPMAADGLGRPRFGIADLVDELEARWDGHARIGIVETAGGLRSPIADDGDCLAFAKAVGSTDVVLVADAGLGAINAVRLATGALSALPLVLLNRFDPASAHGIHVRNAAWLRERDGLDVVTDVDALATRLFRQMSTVPGIGSQGSREAATQRSGPGAGPV
jgi:dethiobiotin synthetase